MEDYVLRLHSVDPQAANPPNQRADIAIISTSLPNPGSSMLHLLHIIDNMMDLSILLGLLPFFVHGRSTICTTVPLTSAVMWLSKD